MVFHKTTAPTKSNLLKNCILFALLATSILSAATTATADKDVTTAASFKNIGGVIVITEGSFSGNLSAAYDLPTTGSPNVTLEFLGNATRTDALTALVGSFWTASPIVPTAATASTYSPKKIVSINFI